MPPPAIPASLQERYRLVRELGRGGMGVVYEVEDRRLGRMVALKLSTHLTSDLARARFVREAQVAAGLNHPGVIQVFDSGIADGIPWLTMELVEGESLDDLPCPEHVEQVFLKVAEALEAIHAEGLVHRDVKPGNILCAGDRVLVTDFGLVHDPDKTALTATGTLPGTVPFMAPEVLQGEPVAPAADWWALGVAMFEVLERRLPFQHPEVMALAAGQIRELPPFTKVDPESRAARMARAWVQVDPARRPASVAALLRALGEGAAPDDAEGAGSTAMRRSELELSAPEVSRPSRGVFLAAMAAGIGAVGLVLAAVLPRPAGEPGAAASAAPPSASPEAAAPDPVRRALARLETPAFRDRLTHPDPWVWGRALGQDLALQELWPLLATPSRYPELEPVDAALRRLGRPSPLRAHLDLAPLEDPATGPEGESWKAFRLYWPADADGFLRRMARVARRIDAAADFLDADIAAAERGLETSARYPFPEFSQGIFAINGWDLALGLMETRPDIRERAHEWLRPGEVALREVLAAAGASMRESPRTAAFAAVLATRCAARGSRSFYSWLAEVDPTWLIGRAPSTAPEWFLRGYVMARQDGVRRRGHRQTEDLAGAMVEATERALLDPPGGVSGGWMSALALQKLCDAAENGYPVPRLAALTTRHWDRLLALPLRDVVANTIRAFLKAQRSAPESAPLSREQAAQAAAFLEAHPEALAAYQKRLPRYLAQLAAIQEGQPWEP